MKTIRTVHPPIDPEVAAGLALLGKGAPTTITADDIKKLRETNPEYLISDEQLRRGGAIEFEEITVPGPPNAPDISLLVCRPSGAMAPNAGIYVTHGGGMIGGDNRAGIDNFLDWVVELGVVLVSVEYRLAPEHPDPAPVEDCYAGLVWTGEHAEELGIDPARLLVVGGSAGGGLAAAMALMARDRGGPPLIGQLLMCPMLDDRNETPSSHMLDGEGIWDRTSNLTGWTALLGDRRGGPDVSSYAAPARERNLAGLPPAFIDVGEVEVFRDEAVDYATRIWQAGGSAELHIWPGAVHGFDQIFPQAAVSQVSISTRTDGVRRLLSP
ncbi:alpha/beta hydrolase [Streptomyces phaeochromogenes]|uniref:alpha/beta hydrolase n=1 Tax=Streptomyces phaeochromogenes TaxID=1923 RepID=UPI002DDA1DFE|nr:alpha/beta hydrolase [Streptomyces phaeochromogenes]WRZ34662.1 alpha/beta hydrolase [Streptomyces phaeochromogenes]